MDSKSILYGAGKNDECYTPAYAVRPILKYLPSPQDDYVIWCPFDRDDSQFPIILKENGYKVINTHIDYGQDFYTYQPKEHWDVMISNPPFTNKRLIFERALSFGKPFALIMSNTWLNDSAPKQLFKDKDLQLLMFDKRISFSNNGVVNNKITFSSSYWCWNFLPKQIIMESIDTKQ